MVDGVEVAFDVHLQAPLVPIRQSSRHRNGRPLSFALAAGISLVDERTFQPFADYGDECMMHDALLNWSGGDGAFLRVMDLEEVVLAETERTVSEFAMERVQILLKIGGITAHIGAATFPLANAVERRRKVLAVDYKVEYVAEPLHSTSSSEAA